MEKFENLDVQEMNKNEMGKLNGGTYPLAWVAAAAAAGAVTDEMIAQYIINRYIIS